MKYTEFQQSFVNEIEKVNAMLTMTTQHCATGGYDWCSCLTETREEAIALNEKLTFDTEFTPKMKSDRRRIGARYYSKKREQGEWGKFSPETKKAKDNKLNLINK